MGEGVILGLSNRPGSYRPLFGLDPLHSCVNFGLNKLKPER